MPIVKASPYASLIWKITNYEIILTTFLMFLALVEVDRQLKMIQSAFLKLLEHFWKLLRKYLREYDKIPIQEDSQQNTHLHQTTE